VQRVLYHGLAAGLSSALAAVVYQQVYFFALGTDFKMVITTAGIISLNILIAFIACLGYYFFSKLVTHYRDALFNLIFSVFTFASLILPIAISLPLNVPSPELFLGLAAPLLIFPQFFWLVTKSLIKYE
jgi:hypothetical protein